MNPHVSLKLKQTQQLNQGLQQSLRVLQMSSLDIEREVEGWLEDNPLLERVEGETSGETDFNARLSASLPSGRHSGGDEAEEAWLNVAAEEDFKTYLHAQVCEHPLSEQEAAYVHILIDSLDEKGYLSDSLSEIADNTPLEWLLDEAHLQTALDQLQTFDPAGVAAADVPEALILQLMRLPSSPERRLAAQLIQQHWHDLGKNRQQNIIRFHKIWPDMPPETIQAALDLISSLNPYPAYGFASAEPTAYIQPDVWVRESENGWIVECAEAAWPQIQISPEYDDWLHLTDVSEEWKNKLAEARQKISSLQQRQDTVLRLAKYIVERQEDFFTFGEIGLVPMQLKDAAAALKLAESTISRASNQKYLACPRGVFALRYFFTQAVGEEDGHEGLSQNAVKAMISRLIENEDSHCPYSDTALVQRLQQNGVDIARRTVAKYREALDIPPAHKRRIQPEQNCGPQT